MYFGLKIYFNLNNMKNLLIYPFLKDGLSLSPSIRNRAYQEITNELSKIENIEVSYLKSINVIVTRMLAKHHFPHPRDYDELIVELLNGITLLCKKEF